MRYYGTAVLNGDTWQISAEPHIIMRLKRVFERISKGEVGTVTLSHNLENCRDLAWFCQRYALEISPEDRRALEDGARAHQENILFLEQLADSSYTPPSLPMAIPLREYQLRATQIYLAQGHLLLGDDVGLGKAQPLSAKVLTPTGWRCMGDLAVGDAVIDPDGGFGYVTGIYPQGLKSVYRVTTKDGRSTECCDDHLWLIQTANDRQRKTDRVLPLKEFRSKLKVKKGSNLCSDCFLPLTKPVEFAEGVELPVHPYLLGVLLGNGSLSTSIGLSDCHAETLERVSNLLPAELSLVPNGAPCDFRITKGRTMLVRNSLRAGLRELGLLGKRSWEKSIPDKYLVASVESRTQLLQGLMDTDGYCDKSGMASYTSTSWDLIVGVRELLESLGGFASVYTKAPKYSYKGEKKVGRTAYTLHIRVPFNPFQLSDKANRWHLPYMARAIEDVEHVGTQLTQCVRVSTKRSLYITDGYIVTHNTATFIGSFTDPRTLPVLVVTKTFLPRQWKEEIERFLPGLHVHIIQKTKLYELPKVDGRGPDVVVINYHKLSAWAQVLAQYCKSVVYDEIQELRHSESQKYAAARYISERAAFRGAASATPIYNYGGEIYNVLNLVKPGCLGTEQEFVREWCVNYYTHVKIKDPSAFGTYLREQFLMLRRTRHEVGRELPALQKIPYRIDADPEAIQAAESTAFELAKIILANTEEFKGQRMQASEQLSILIRQATGVAKAPYVADFVRLLLESGERVIVVGWHRAVYDIWESRLKEFNPVYITGTESVNQKQASKDAFIRGDTNLMFLSLRSGEGIDGLQKVCRTMVMGELDYSPGVHEQVIGRIYRDGQQDPVTAYFLVSEHGSDPVMSEILGLKREQVEGIKNPGQDIIEKLEIDGTHIRKLAVQYLLKRGVDPEKMSA